VIRQCVLLALCAVSVGAQESSRKEVRRAARDSLFSGTAPLAVALRFDRRALFADRDTLSARRYDGRLIVTEGDRVDSMPVRLRPRGHYRLGAANCDFVPLLIEFRDRPTRGTVFDGQSSLKLVTHCVTESPVYDEYILREQLVYRMHALLTPASFRTRLVAATYTDSTDRRWSVSRRALLIENEDEVAKRVAGKIRTQRGAVWENLDSTAVSMFALFQYFIGGTDWSLSALHNVRVAQRDDGVYVPLAYDFDWTGMANTPYATPSPRLRVTSTRDRLFRGPCWPVEAYAGAVERFVTKRGALLTLLDTPGLSDEYRSSTREWIGEFFATVQDPTRFARAIKRGCGPST
jgi:hypothetical protein